MTTRIETLRALQARIRASKGADRELDAEIFAAFNDGQAREMISHLTHTAYWQVTIGRRIVSDIPEITASLDACVALMAAVLPGAEFEITTLYGIAHVELPLNGADVYPSQARRTDCNICLAFCECIVSAAIAELEAREKADAD